MSTLVGTKNTLEETVGRVLHKMLTLLEAQYPDEVELAAKRREMGYLKEYNQGMKSPASVVLAGHS